MKAKLLMIGGCVAIALAPLVSPPPQVRADLEPDCAANPYGIDGQLSEQDLKDLFYIAFPQTEQDMRGRFGSPLCLNAVADFYQVEGTHHFIAVNYEGLTATGWRAWEVIK